MYNILKIGYFRKIDTVTGNATYINYKEFYNWDKEHRVALKQLTENGRVKLYCACCLEDTLELTITSNLVIRVKNNKLQENHMDSCPKSIYYVNWNDSSKNGIKSTEDEDIIFNIALPSVLKAKSNSSGSSSSGTGTGVPRDKRTGIFEMVSTLNKVAWEKQTFSKKKEIKDANKAGLPQTWVYKNREEFTRLMFGVANDIYAKVKGQTIPFINLCYRKDLFYACSDWRVQWFIYAEILKIGEVKTERKYQYVTVKMPSDKSHNKAVIRVETELFLKIMQGYEDAMEPNGGRHLFLTGYICRKSFQAEDGTLNEWINLIKGIVVEVNDYGMIVENESVNLVASFLAKERIIFKRPYMPLENYGSEIPTFLIERLNAKNIIIDIPPSAEYEKRVIYAQNNSEYDCVLLRDNEPFEEQIKQLLS